MSARQAASARSEGASKQPKYKLRLFVAGSTPHSMRALHNIRALCRRRLADDYELEVIDIYQQPELAREAQILAVPTLHKREPHPPRRIVGDLSDYDRLLQGLDLPLESDLVDDEDSGR